jgi:hypothetical protein
MTHAHKLMILLAALVLSACGGGDGNSGNLGGPGGSGSPAIGTPSIASSTPDNTPTSSPIPPADRINAALESGDPTDLRPEDRATLLQRATRKAIEQRARPQQILADIYNTKGQAPDLALSIGAGSSTSLSTIGITQAIPFIVSDNGKGMAAITELGTGRALAYGADVLAWMTGSTKEQQHLPLFTRAVSWVMTGQADGNLPTTIKFSQSGYNSTVVKSFMSRLGKQTQEVVCDIASPTNTCWGDADLLVFGADVKDSAGLSDLARSYLKAGKAVIYMHANWAPSDGGTRLLTGLGMSLGGYPGNYFASAPDYTVSANRTAADSLARADYLGKLVQTLQMLARDKYVHDFAADASLIAGIDMMRKDLSDYEMAGQRIFKTENTELQRLLVLWADEWRPEVVYGKIGRTSDAANFLRAYASDSWEAFSRTATTTNPSGQGDYMPAGAQKLATSTDYETIELTLPQGSGQTLIGRGSVPAKAVALAVVDAPTDVNLGLQTSYIRAYGNPLTDNYSRPRRAPSWTVPLQRDAINDFVTPFGGPLFLSYSGATAGQKITLRVKGVIKYAHFDFSQGTPSQAELTEAMAALQRKDYGWSTFKFRGGELQQTIATALKSFQFGMPAGTLRTPEGLVTKRVQSIVMDTDHMVSGYNDMSMPANAAALCTAFGWACEDEVHNPPGNQHFVSWLPNCGSGCSGQPIDNDNWPMDIGWGWAHELGHNNVQRWMTIQIDGKGCVAECDNNTHSSATMLRRYAALGEDASANNTSHDLLYKMIQDSRATGLSGESLRKDMQDRLWDMPQQNSMRAMFFQLAFLYSKVRRDLPQPTADSTVEFFTLLSKGSRLVSSKWSQDSASAYGMSRYPDNKIPNQELMYVLGSRIIGQDLRDVFSMYGIPLSQTALNSVGALGAPVMQQQFYGLGANKSNQLATGQWLSLQGQTPAYPF